MGEVTDADVEKEIWTSSIPVEFTLNESEVTVSEKPVAIYQIILRVSYLGFHVKQVEDYFGSYVTRLSDSANDSIWFSFKGKPVNWHLPVGVLADMLMPGTVPLELTVHFRNFPHDQLLPMKTENDMYCFFKHSLKQACSIRFGSAKPILTLGAPDLTLLCESVRDHSLENFRKVTKVIEESQSPTDYVPVRIFVCKLASTDPVKYLTKTISGNKTLGEFLHSVVPTSFTASDKPKVLIHGVAPEFSTSLSWLEKHCRNPDLWVNVVIVH